MQVPRVLPMDMEGRFALLSALAIAAVLAGCASTTPPPRPVVSTPLPPQGVPTPAALATGDGTITGGLYRCYALAPSISGPPTRVAGTVSVLRGPNAGLPDEIVPTDGTYALQLPPGPYDLVGHWAGSNLAPPMVKVVVSSGRTTRQDLVYTDCK